MIKKLIVGILALMVLLPGCIGHQTQTSPPDSSTKPSATVPSKPPTSPDIKPTLNPEVTQLKTVGQIGGPTQAIAVQDKYAYVGIGMRLAILDVSNPAALNEAGVTEPFGWYVEDVFVIGNMAFVATGGSGLYIIDVSNPTRPIVVGNYDSLGYAESVTVVGKYAYLADGTEGLRVIDITDPAHPAEVATAYGLNHIFDIAIEGKYAYLAAAGAGLLVADVSDPAKPKEVGSLDTSGYAYGLNVSGSTAFVADGWGGLRMVDVSNPTQPKEIGDFDTPGWALDVTGEGNIAYVADATYGLRILDISDKNKPKEIGSYEISGSNAIKLAFSKGVVYLADRSAGLGIFDVTVPDKPVQVGFYSPMGFADAVAVSGNYAYVAAGPYGLRVVDISDLSHPREIGAYETKAYATGVVVLKDYAYVITYSSSEISSGLHIINVSDPAEPEEESFYAIRGMAQDIVVNDNIAYIADEWGLLLIDVSIPAYPTQIGDLDFAQGDGAKAVMATWGVDVSGNMAYVTHGDRLEVLDVSNPKKPTVVGFYKPPDSKKSGAVTIGGNFAYTTMVPGLQVVDISAPDNPKGVGSYNMEAPERLTFANNTIYVADAGAGLLALDVSDPGKPVQAGLQRLPGYAIGLTTAGNHIYVADGEAGLFIVDDVRKQGGTQQISPQSGVSDKGSQDIVGHNSSPVLVKQMANNPKSTEPAAYFSSGHIITVNNPADNGQGTLRWALENAGSGDTITFDPSIFPPKNPVTIRLTSELFWKPGSVTIDASEAGVILDGTGTTSNTNGLNIQSDYNVIKGLQIINFSGNGIQLGGANNTIGGDSSRGSGLIGEGNLISGNGDVGIIIIGGQATGNKIIGNYIGTDLSGKYALGNKNTGVFLSHDASQNIIGSKTEAERNIISGNTRAEISLMSQANGNKVIGNYIGTDASGMTSLGNVAMASISIELGGFNNVIERNVISNEGHIGVIISDWGSWYNEVIGNYIGVDATGSISLGGTGSGIHVNAPFNKVGGTTPDERNIISGNADQGVKIGWWGTTDVLVLGNYIGTDVTGLKPIANGIGISIGEGTHNTFVGGSTEGEHNIISGNDMVGISIDGTGTDYNFVTGNYIGTDATGASPLANVKAGIIIKGGGNNFIQDNLVAYNQSGVSIESGDNNRLHHNTLIQNSKCYDRGNNNVWDNGHEGNYWSDYSGKDANGDGVGDNPYSVSPNGVDRYPLMKPYPK